jgi:hypothetical protein
MNDGIRRVYEWAGSKNGKVDIKEVPEELVQYLMMNTIVFRDGELAIVEDTPETKEILENVEDDYKNNTHTRNEIVKLLEGNFMKMKSELKKITNKQELVYICEIAKEIRLDSNSKLQFLAELMKIPQDILFDNDSEE